MRQAGGFALCQVFTGSHRPSQILADIQNSSSMSQLVDLANTNLDSNTPLMRSIAPVCQVRHTDHDDFYHVPASRPGPAVHTLTRIHLVRAMKIIVQHYSMVYGSYQQVPYLSIHALPIQ